MVSALNDSKGELNAMLRANALCLPPAVATPAPARVRCDHDLLACHSVDGNVIFEQQL